MENKRIINLTVLNRKYPIRVDKEDEETEENLRKAVKLINKKMIQYQNKFSNKDNFDILAMASIQIAKMVIQHDHSDSSQVDINELLELTDRLDEILD